MFAQVLSSKKKRSGNEKIICPYHGWFYNYEGKLIGIPEKSCFKILPKNQNLNQIQLRYIVNTLNSF